MRVNRREMALSRIEILMQMSDRVHSKDRALADRYAALAKRLSMRHNAKFPRKWKRRICKKCGKFLVPGDNSRVRTKNNRIVITCLECNNMVRIPFK